MANDWGKVKVWAKRGVSFGWYFKGNVLNIS
jgi:hypothetical protein